MITIAAVLFAANYAHAQSLVQLQKSASVDPSQLEIPQPPPAEPDGLVLETASLGNGDAAPNFALKDLAGGGNELAKLRGKVVLVEFWASWCGPCKQSMPKLVAIHQQYKDKGLVILAISLDNDENDLRAYLKDNPVPFKVLFEPARTAAVIQAYDVKTIPRSFVVGKDGRLVLANGTPQKETELVQAIEAALLAP